MRGICSDEYDLWAEWFATDGALYPFLEAVMDPFYDHLRPRIIHETQLQKLCELCTMVQTRYMEDEDEDEPDSPQPQKLDFAHLINPALEDAQSRLVFLTVTTLRNDIENFKPKPEDLDYPARASRVPLSGTKANGPVLSGRKGSNGPLTPLPKTPIIVDEDNPDGFSFTSSMQDCYPTLRKAVWLLSRIYRLVHVSISHNEGLSIANMAIVNSLRRLSPSNSPPNNSLPTLRWHTNQLSRLSDRCPTFPHQASPNAKTTNRSLRHRIRLSRRLLRLHLRHIHILGAPIPRRPLQPHQPRPTGRRRPSPQSRAQHARRQGRTRRPSAHRHKRIRRPIRQTYD